MSKHRITSTEPLKRLRRTLVKNHCGRCFAAFFRGGCFAIFLEGGLERLLRSLRIKTITGCNHAIAPTFRFDKKNSPLLIFCPFKVKFCKNFFGGILKNLFQFKILQLLVSEIILASEKYRISPALPSETLPHEFFKHLILFINKIHFDSLRRQSNMYSLEPEGSEKIMPHNLSSNRFFLKLQYIVDTTKALRTHARLNKKIDYSINGLPID